MARQVVAIVEGHGEAEALPTLLRRLRQWLTPQDFADFPPTDPRPSRPFFAKRR